QRRPRLLGIETWTGNPETQFVVFQASLEIRNQNLVKFGADFKNMREMCAPIEKRHDRKTGGSRLHHTDLWGRGFQYALIRVSLGRRSLPAVPTPSIHVRPLQFRLLLAR